MPMIAEPCSSHEWTFVRRAVLIVACLHTAALLAIASVAQARTSPGAVKLPNEIEFKAPVNPGVQTAVLYGDPSKEGVYVARNKLPAGLKIMPHTPSGRVAHRRGVVRNALFLQR